jgi:hypothetical protein
MLLFLSISLINTTSASIYPVQCSLFNAMPAAQTLYRGHSDS